MTRRIARSFPLLFVCLFFLAACESSEERVDKHVQNGIRLVEAGDNTRAILEFLNALRIDPAHEEARVTLARVALADGDVRTAARHYKFMAESDPTHLEANRVLAEIAIDNGEWETAERYGRRAFQTHPDVPEIQAISVILDYHAALVAEDDPARRAAAVDASALAQDLTDTTLIRQVVIDDRFRDGDFEGALVELDGAIAAGDESLENYRLRLTALRSLGRDEDFEAGLEHVVAKFPEAPEFRDALIQWYISRNDIEQAEMFFRSEVTTAKNRDDALVTVVDFIQQTRGREAAMDELRQLIETEENTDLFRSLLAGFKFEGGAVLEAIGDLEAVVKDAELSTQTNNIKITLSRMLLLVGEGDRALTLASEVLTQDPTNVGALKIRASHEIEADQAGNAILTLRAAQDVAPRDPEILTIMARAYLRNGNRSLAGEMLSLAFEISEEAPTEGLRYAEFLQSDGALSSSLTVLQGALNRSPASVPLLAEMGAVQVGLEDFNRAERTESQLRALGTEEGSRAADRLRLERLRKQERVEEAIALIRELSGDDLNAAAMAEIIGIHMSTGEPEKAETYLEGVLDEDPENRAARFYLATLFALSDRLGLAETYLRGLIADSPDDEIVWRTLYTIKLQQRDEVGAGEVLTEGLSRFPDAPDLLWFRAAELERDGDLEGAIAIYEDIYARDSTSLVIANNLASLLSVTSEEPEIIDRAYTIARRLRDVDVPAFQDTYGWIAFRKGELLEALEHLEPAAAGLPGDPVVQYHLGATLAELGRDEEALAVFRRVEAIVGESKARPEFDLARDEIERLEPIVAAREAVDGN